MGKHKEKHDSYEDDNDSDQVMLSDMDYELDDDAFFMQFQPKKTRSKNTRARDARRRIEQYKEDRELAGRLDEYYNHPDD